MSISANSQISELSQNQESSSSLSDNSLAAIGAELVYIQDSTGRYLSFDWQQSEKLGLNTEQILHGVNGQSITPVDSVAYLRSLQQVLTNLVPQRYQCWFRHNQQFLELELVISPILPALGNTTTNVLVMGRLLQITATNQTQSAEFAPSIPTKIDSSPQEHQQLINKITRNIRRTLDLDVIWQQTVDSLGTALQVERCVVFPYKRSSSRVQAIAEYHQPRLNSMLGVDIEIKSDSGFAIALATRKPILVTEPIYEEFDQQKMLVVATCYQNSANGLITLSLNKQSPNLNAKQLQLVKEVADQIGTAIAHATLYKELEAARQQAERGTNRIREFLAKVTHELRTPLNGIIGFLRLILDGMADDPEEQKQFLAEAHKSSLHLLNIVNDILDIAKIEAGKMELELVSIKLDDLFGDVDNFMRLQVEQKNLSFRMQTPDTNDDIIIYGDYQRLKQVMFNLIGNAIKFTFEGHITVTADVVRKKLDFQDQEFPGMVRVRVVDTGIGVSLDKQDKLFQLFSQVDGSRTRQYGGTGLGLAISQKLVEAMGGEVHFYSLGEGLGSTVTFTVPLYQQPVLVTSSNSE